MEEQDRAAGITILVDHHMEGQATSLLAILAREGWLALLPIRLVTFANVNLPHNASDRQVWRFAQEQQMVVLTGNRNMKGMDSLEWVIREENSPTSLPVVTIGRVDRLEERDYRERCAFRLIELLMDLGRYLGAGRLCIP